MLEVWKPTGNVKITVRSLDGKVIEETYLKNALVMSGRKLWRDMLKGTITDGQIKYVGVGSSNQVIADADIKLVAETFRNVRTTDAVPADDSYITTFYLGPTQANGTIKEIGWFCGVDATAIANSGVLLARVLWSHTKLDSESVEITRTDSIAEA